MRILTSTTGNDHGHDHDWRTCHLTICVRCFCAGDEAFTALCDRIRDKLERGAGT